jgi:hypothetical protein
MGAKMIVDTKGLMNGKSANKLLIDGKDKPKS